MRFLMQLPNWKGKGTIAAKSNLHPAGVYLALIPYGIRRWALTPPLHNHLFCPADAKTL